MEYDGGMPRYDAEFYACVAACATANARAQNRLDSGTTASWNGISPLKRPASRLVAQR